MDRSRTSTGWRLATAVAVIAAGCVTAGPGPNDPAVVVTTSIWADIVENVACDTDVEIEVLIPAGVDAHSFEPSLADRARLEAASLVVANAAGLEEGIAGMLDAVAGEGVRVLAVADHIAEPHHAGSFDDHGPSAGQSSEEHGGDTEVIDPHVWLDPVGVSGALDALAAALVDSGVTDDATVRECVSAYRADLGAVTEEIDAMIATIPPERRLLVSNHTALGYFADRFELEVLGTVIGGTSSFAEPSASDLAELTERIEAAGVRTVFAGVSEPEAVITAIAGDLGLDVVELHIGSLGPPGSGAETYVGLLRTNAGLIAEGLGGQ